MHTRIVVLLFATAAGGATATSIEEDELHDKDPSELAGLLLDMLMSTFSTLLVLACGSTLWPELQRAWNAQRSNNVCSLFHTLFGTTIFLASRLTTLISC